MATKRKYGRPSKYKTKYCDMIIDHMAEGYSFESFGAIIDVNQDTLHEWAKRHEEFSEAKKLAFTKSRYYWEKTGIEGLQTTVMRKGNMTVTKTLNVRVWELNLKSKFKEWRNVDKSEDQDPQNRAPFQLVIHPPKDEKSN